MRRLITKGTFTQVPLTSGTIQNASGIKTVEVSDVQEEGSGILLLPLNKISFANKTLYVRCVDGAGAEVVVVPFEVDAGGGGGSSGGLSGVTADFSLTQFGTDVVKNFKFSALEYPNATNPNLDGKTVLVMATKDANETTQLVKYIFVDLTELVGTSTLYKPSDNAIGISGASIGLNLSASAGNILSVADDGLYGWLGVAGGVSGNFAIFGGSGAIIDGGFSLADLVVGGGSGSGASYAVATPLSDGLMSAADKSKLDGLKNYTLPTASTSVKGGVKVGGGLSMVGEVLNVTLQPESYTLPTASTSAKGGIIVGSGLEMNGDILNASTYTLPTASTTQKGGVVIGGGLSMAGDTLSVTIQPETYTLPTASTSTKGGVKIGTGLTMDGEVLNANEYTLPTASTSTKGGIIVGGGLSMNGDILSVTLQGGTPSGGGTVGILDTVPATVDGGLWYEVTDGVPSLWIRKGNYGYGFNYDRLNFAGDTSSGLVAYLPFTNNFADACGNKWSSGVNPEYSANIEVLVKPIIVDGSLYVDGRSWLVNDSISSSIGALPWTVDFWGNFSSGSGFWGTFNTLYPSGANQWVGMKWNGGTVAMHFYANDPAGSITVQADTRHHYAMTYDGTIVRMFVDGVLSLEREHQITLGGDFLIGAAAGKETSKGYIDHFRIHKGVALWTENFTPPTAADYL